MVNEPSYLKHPCPKCKVDAGWRCRTEKTDRPTDPHRARLDLIGTKPKKDS